MDIRDISSTHKRFEELEGGAIFQLDRQYYCKLCEEVYLPAEPGERMEMYNAVNLYDGAVCNIADTASVESLAGHTLEILD